MHTCVSFQRSIDFLCLPKCNAYGVDTGDENTCTKPWPICDRNKWIDALACSEDEISIDLGAPLCAQEICNELHPTNCTERLRYSPIAYLGSKSFSDPEILELDYSEEGYGFVIVCPVDPDVVTLDNIVFDYPDDPCFKGSQELQEPCLEFVPDCDGVGGLGIKATWEICQLARPDKDVIKIKDTACFLVNVQWRYWQILPDSIYTVVDECDCSSCSKCANPMFDITINNAELGEVCIEPTPGSCGCGKRKVLINYAKAFDCNREMSPALEQAVILYALVKMGKDDPCGCDEFKAKLKWWLSEDPSAGQAFAKDILYGSTRAGMSVWRTLLKLKKRMKFDSNRGRGGYLGSRRIRGFRTTGGRIW